LLLKTDGYETLFAERGEEALVMAAECQPDLILLDIMMPGMDGYQYGRNHINDVGTRRPLHRFAL
jgi:CheY-like chemotaxis protein